MIDPDTFLVTVYCILDDLYREHFGPRAGESPWESFQPAVRGRKPAISDSEVLTLVFLAQRQKNSSERAFLRFAFTHLRSYFPNLLSQSAFSRRARALGEALCQLAPLISEKLEAFLGPKEASGWDYEVFDSVAVPLMRRRRGVKGKLFGNEAAIGHGGSDDDWYYGVKLLGSVSPAGFITGFVSGPANIADQWLAQSLLLWRSDPNAPMPTAEQMKPILGPSHQRGGGRKGPTGPISGNLSAGSSRTVQYLADSGFRGENWKRHWLESYHAQVLNKADYEKMTSTLESPESVPRFSSRRQLVESAFQWLIEVFGLRFPRARTWAGLVTRLAAKVGAFNLAVLINRMYGNQSYEFSKLPL